MPALTTISVDPQGMGRRAAQLLLKQINSGKVEAEAIVSAVRLVVRQSSELGWTQRQGGPCHDKWRCKMGPDRRKHDRP